MRQNPPKADLTNIPQLKMITKKFKETLDKRDVYKRAREKSHLLRWDMESSKSKFSK